MTQAETPVVMTLTPLQARTVSALAFRSRMALGRKPTKLQQSYADTLLSIEQAVKSAMKEIGQ